MNEFNPIKEDKEGVLAKRTVWSTRSLDLAIKGVTDGRRLVANPFYENNIKLLKGDLVFERTDEEIAEWKKCSKDIIYFAEKYCQLMTPQGIQHIKLRDYQKRYLQFLIQNRLTIYLACRQAAKCITFDTLIRIKGVPPVDKLKRKWDSNYYIKEEGIYEIPIFELYNLFNDSKKWKLKYIIYTLIYKLKQYEKRK